MYILLNVCNRSINVVVFNSEKYMESNMGDVLNRDVL